MTFAGLKRFCAWRIDEISLSAISDSLTGTRNTVSWPLLAKHSELHQHPESNPVKVYTLSAGEEQETLNIGHLDVSDKGADNE